MPNSFEMNGAAAEFRRIMPNGCSLDPKVDKPIYTLVNIEGWPSFVHYEFRFTQRSGLFVELHVENKEYAWLGNILRECRNDAPSIEGLFVAYDDSRPPPNRKKWPSLSIELGPGVAGSFSAQVMVGLINATRETVTRALDC